MAYFANATVSEHHISLNCEGCVHYKETSEESRWCPVLELHWRWNYEALEGNKRKATPEALTKHIALNTLWPRDGAHNKQCAMFYPEEGE